MEVIDLERLPDAAADAAIHWYQDRGHAQALNSPRELSPGADELGAGATVGAAPPATETELCFGSPWPSRFGASIRYSSC